MPRPKCCFLTGLLATVGLVIFMGVAPQPAAADCHRARDYPLVQVTTKLAIRVPEGAVLPKLESSNETTLVEVYFPKWSPPAGAPYLGNGCDPDGPPLPWDAVCIIATFVLSPDGKPQIKVVADPDCKVNRGSGPPRGPKDDDPR